MKGNTLSPLKDNNPNPMISSSVNLPKKNLLLEYDVKQIIVNKNKGKI